MVSVLPAHVALEMKTKMIREIRKAQMKSYLTDDEFVHAQNRNQSKSEILNSTADGGSNSNNFIGLAARKLSFSLKNSFVKQKQNDIQIKSSSNSTLKKSGTNAYFNDKTQRKTGFHDLHIKSHNNVRLETSSF